MAQPILIGWLLITILAATSAKSHGYRIIGGELANITEVPHQVYIQKDGNVWCGGSIISSQHILTTSTCVRFETNLYSVVTAATVASSGGEEYAIAKITNHPNKIDLAVFKLAKEINFSEKARSIALAGPRYRIKDGTELIASGWGYTEVPRSSDRLRKVTVSKVSDVECKATFNNVDTSNVFCAGGKEKKPCWFDEGGPLIAKNGQRNVLVGVIIYTGYDCDENKQKPGLFTRVSYYNKWINKIVKEE